MTTAYMPHLSAIAKRGGRRAPRTFTAWDNAMCEAAWHILGAGEGLQRLAHRISGGDTPLGDERTVSHLYRVGKAVGIPASGLARRAEILGRDLWKPAGRGSR